MKFFVFVIIILNMKFIVKGELYKNFSKDNIVESGRKINVMSNINFENHIKNGINEDVEFLNLNKGSVKGLNFTENSTIDKKFKDFYHHRDFLSNNNYEEANVSVILNSEAGPIAIDGFKDKLFRFKNLATTKRPEDYRLEHVYDDDSLDLYEDLQQTSYNENSALTKNFENIKNFWSIYNAFYTLWNSYYNLKKKTQIKRETNETFNGLIEGRYIKGDPLKGYYDFVITEGSYKFWAAFQLATAVLIIYSTFAAIYYSKVNPLVGDYDYVDYLGGGRTFFDDADFNDNIPEKESLKSSRNFFKDGSYVSSLIDTDFQNWLPKWKYSLIFVLNAIDKLPLRD